MINELVKLIEDMHQNMGGLLSPRMAIISILNKAEELGMLPPSTIKRIEPSDMKSIFNWEPEE